MAGGVLLLSGCASLQRSAMQSAGDSLAAASLTAFATDEDLILVGDALPFALKFLDTLLVNDPESVGLLVSAAAGYIQYASAYLDWPATRQKASDYEAASALQARAGRLYQRGREYALRALELQHPGFRERLIEHPELTLAACDPTDVPLLYWAGAGWAGAIAMEPGNMQEIAGLPMVGALLQRALALDETWNQGALHEFLILYEGSRSAMMGGSPDRARFHFHRALELSGEANPTPYINLAVTVSIQNQDFPEFRSLLQTALATEKPKDPTRNLADRLAREKAAWYLDHPDDFFLTLEEVTP